MWGEARAKGAEQRGQWLKDSRFAMFIHWGLYSELGGHWNGKAYYGISEWIMNRAKIPAAEYEKVAQRFNPIAFDAREWVHTATAACMRPIMITSKPPARFARSVEGDNFTVDTGLIIQGPPIGTNTTGQEAEGPHCITGGESH